MTKIKKLIKSFLWSMMDFFQKYVPFLYKYIKKGFPRRLKNIILAILMTRSVEEDAQVSSSLDTGKKITIIFKDDAERNYWTRFSTFLLDFCTPRQYILISPNKKKYKNLFGHRIKVVATLGEAILQTTGDYVFLMDSGVSLLPSFRGLYKKIIHENPAELYLGSYINKKEEIVRIGPEGIQYDYSSSPLPREAGNGLILISRELIIRCRLPRHNNFSQYLSELSDYVKNSEIVERPFIRNTAVRYRKHLECQEDSLNRRYFYSNESHRPNNIKKVLFIVPYLVIGGAEKVLLDLVAEYYKRGIQVHIFCTHKKGEWSNRFKEAGALIWIAKNKNITGIVSEIHRLAIKNQYDIIHISNTEYGHYYAPKTKELRKQPIVVDTIHSHNNPLCRHTINYQSSFDAIITVNGLIATELAKKINPNKLKVVHNGVAVVAEPSNAVEGYRKKIIGYVGRVSEEKNPLEFIRIAKELSLEDGRYEFRVCGDGPLLQEMKNLAKKLGLGSKIKFLGSVQNGAAEIAKLSCLVLTSHTEGLPITLLESLSLGVPVVAAKVGGIPEVIESGVEGFLVNGSDNTMGYLGSIKKIFKSDKEYLDFSVNAMKKGGEYSAEKMADKTLKIYKDLVRNPRPKFEKLTTIAMLSYNRTDEIKKTIETIYNNTKMPFNLLVLDNNSEVETRNFLKDFASKNGNIQVIFEGNNLGCPGGRRKMLERIEADYIVTIDNDMEVPRYWLRDLIIRLEEDKKIYGVCVKDVFPWGKVEFTGGKIFTDNNGFAIFASTHYRENYFDTQTLEEIECDWIPGGATIWRGDVKKIAEHAKEYVNAFEDFDYSIQIKRKGYRIVNCPNVMFIHNHAKGFDPKKTKKEEKYLKDRYNQEGFLRSLAVFYRRTGYVMKNDRLYADLGLPITSTKEEIETVLRSKASDVKSI